MGEAGQEFFPPAVISPKVELWDYLENLKRPAIPVADAVIVFGQGPVIDAETKVKAKEAQGGNKEQEVNSWGRTVAVAVGYLKKRGNEFREVFYSGGKTGGPDFPSEGELMAEGVEAVYGKITDPDYVEHTDPASNTLDNIGDSLSKMDDLHATNPDRTFEKLALVSAHFHAPRIRMLAGLFNLRNVTVFSAEEVVKVMMHDPKIDEGVVQRVADYLIPGRVKSGDPRKAVLDWLDERTDLTRDVNRTESGNYRSFVGGGKSITQKSGPYTQFEKAQEAHPGGEERHSYVQRAYNEADFVRGLTVIPENWLGYLAKIKNDGRLKGILRNIEEWNPGFLQKVGVDVSVLGETDQGKIKEGLGRVRTILEPFQFNPKEGGRRVYVDLGKKPYGSTDPAGREYDPRYSQEFIDSQTKLLDHINHNL